MAFKVPDSLDFSQRKQMESYSGLQSIETHILDPEVASSDRLIFKLPKTGVLDSGSMVVLSLKVPAGVTEGFLPTHTGIASVVERAELSVGDTVLQTTPEFGVYHTMKRSLREPEERALIDYVLEGAVDDRSAFTLDSDGGKLCVRDINYVAPAATGVAGTIPPFVKPTDTSSGNTQYRLLMGDLFPSFRTRQLPLFALSDHVLITLHLKQQVNGTASDVGKVLCYNSGFGGDTGYSMDVPNTFFVYDSIAFNAPSNKALMAQVNSESGKSFIYSDVILTRMTLDAVAQPVAGAVTIQDFDRQVAVAGRTVRALTIFDRKLGAAPHCPFMGQYATFVSNRPDELQLQVNDRQVFQSRLISDTQKKHQYDLSQNVKLKCHPLLYSADPITDKTDDARGVVGTSAITDATLQGHAQTSMLVSQHHVGVDLTLGGQNELGNGLLAVKPALLQRRMYRTATHYESLESLVYCLVERVASIKFGVMMATA